MSLSVLKLRKLRLLCETRTYLSVNLYKIYSTNYENYFNFGDLTLIPVQSSLVTGELRKLFWTSGSGYSHPQAVTKVTYSLAWLTEVIPLLTTSRTPLDGRLQSLIITSESRETTNSTKLIPIQKNEHHQVRQEEVDLQVQRLYLDKITTTSR